MVLISNEQYEKSIKTFAFSYLIESFDPQFKEDLKDVERYSEFGYLINSRPNRQVNDWESGADYELQKLDHFMTQSVIYNQFLKSINQYETSASQLLHIIKRLDSTGDFIAQDEVYEIWFDCFKRIMMDEVVEELYEDDWQDMDEEDDKFKDASIIIKKAWELCRWNPDYKMCHVCEIKNLKQIFLDHGKKL
tara:strand:- start:120 stop:695 length:576 start_codon:yes stop_codon:yes gene_type:complete